MTNGPAVIAELEASLPNWLELLRQATRTNTAAADGVEAVLGYVLDTCPAVNPLAQTDGFPIDPFLGRIEELAAAWVRDRLDTKKIRNTVVVLSSLARHRLTDAPSLHELAERTRRECETEAEALRAEGREGCRPYLRARKIAGLIDAVRLADFNENPGGVLHPKLMDLPLPSDNSPALNLIGEYDDDLTGPKEERRERIQRLNDRSLAPRLRVVQWDVMLRDLKGNPNQVAYRPGTKVAEVPGVISERMHAGLAADFLAGHQPAAGPTGRPLDLPYFRGAFNTLLSRAGELASDTYPVLTRYFADAHAAARPDATGSAASDTILIEDGDLTLFTLLWLFRRYRRMADRVPNWFDAHRTRHPVLFVGPDRFWVDVDLEELVTACGLFSVACPDGTPRWHTLLRWLEQRQKQCRSGCPDLSGTEAGYDAATRRFLLDVGIRVGDGPPPAGEPAFLQALLRFYRSPLLTRFFEQVGCRTPAGRSRWMDLRQLFDCMAEAGLLDTGPPSAAVDGWWEDDLVLFRVHRTGCLPLEFLFRAYQPHEMHLLILAMNYKPPSDGVADPAGPRTPLTLGFATIAGRIPDVAIGQGPDLAWLNVYRTFFRGLTSTFALLTQAEAVSEIAKLEGSQKRSRVIAHELAQAGNLLRAGSPKSSIVVPWADARDVLRHDDRWLNESVLVCTDRALYESAVAYIDLVSDAKSADSPCDKWQGRPLVDCVRSAVEWAQQIAYGRWYSRFPNRHHGVHETARRLFYGPRSVLVVVRGDLGGLRLPRLDEIEERMPAEVLKNDPHGPYRFIRAVARALIAAILNVVQRVAEQEYPEHFPVQVVIQWQPDTGRFGLVITNPTLIPDLAERLEPRNGTALVLQQARDDINSYRGILSTEAETEMGRLETVPFTRLTETESLLFQGHPYLFKTYFSLTTTDPQLFGWEAL